MSRAHFRLPRQLRLGALSCIHCSSSTIPRYLGLFSLSLSYAPRTFLLSFARSFPQCYRVRVFQPNLFLPSTSSVLGPHYPCHPSVTRPRLTTFLHNTLSLAIDLRALFVGTFRILHMKEGVQEHCWLILDPTTGASATRLQGPQFRPTSPPRPLHVSVYSAESFLGAGGNPRSYLRNSFRRFREREPSIAAIEAVFFRLSIPLSAITPRAHRSSKPADTRHRLGDDSVPPPALYRLHDGPECRKGYRRGIGDQGGGLPFRRFILSQRIRSAKLGNRRGQSGVETLASLSLNGWQ